MTPRMHTDAKWGIPMEIPHMPYPILNRKKEHEYLSKHTFSLAFDEEQEEC